MTKIIKRLFDVIFVLMIIILVGYLALRYTEQVTIYKVKTRSMEDNIHVGDYILIVKKSEYKVGDIVTYTINDEFITHRIIRKNGDSIVTKGDANNIEDKTIDQKCIVGKAIMWGGILNIIINYKYAIVGLLLSLYLFSCYFSEENKTEEVLDDEINNNFTSLDNEESKLLIIDEFSENIDELKNEDVKSDTVNNYNTEKIKNENVYDEKNENKDNKNANKIKDNLEVKNELNNLNEDKKIENQKDVVKKVVEKKSNNNTLTKSKKRKK